MSTPILNLPTEIIELIGKWLLVADRRCLDNCRVIHHRALEQEAIKNNTNDAKNFGKEFDDAADDDEARSDIPEMSVSDDWFDSHSDTEEDMELERQQEGNNGEEIGYEEESMLNSQRDAQNSAEVDDTQYSEGDSSETDEDDFEAAIDYYKQYHHQRDHNRHLLKFRLACRRINGQVNRALEPIFRKFTTTLDAKDLEKSTIAFKDSFISHLVTELTIDASATQKPLGRGFQWTYLPPIDQESETVKDDVFEVRCSRSRRNVVSVEGHSALSKKNNAQAFELLEKIFRLLSNCRKIVIHSEIDRKCVYAVAPHIHSMDAAYLIFTVASELGLSFISFSILTNKWAYPPFVIFDPRSLPLSTIMNPACQETLSTLSELHIGTLGEISSHLEALKYPDRVGNVSPYIEHFIQPAIELSSLTVCLGTLRVDQSQPFIDALSVPGRQSLSKLRLSQATLSKEGLQTLLMANPKISLLELTMVQLQTASDWKWAMTMMIDALPSLETVIFQGLLKNGRRLICYPRLDFETSRLQIPGLEIEQMTLRTARVNYFLMMDMTAPYYRKLKKRTMTILRYSGCEINKALGHILDGIEMEGYFVDTEESDIELEI